MSNEVLLAALALLGALASSKLVDHLSSKQAKAFDDGVLRRQELLSEIKELQQENRRLSELVDSWQDKYYASLLKQGTRGENGKKENT